MFVLSDLDLGMNQWMTETFEYPDRPIDRGKVLTAEDLKRLGGFARYKDVDGDGVGYRTLPGTDHPLAAYFSRGTGHNERAQLSERPTDWENNMARLGRKFETARQLVPPPVEDRAEGAEVGIISYGSADSAVKEARDLLAKAGIKTSYLRLRALPMTQQTTDFIAAHQRMYVVELNTDAQMLQLLRLHAPELATRVLACNHSDGLPLTAKWIADAIAEGKRLRGSKGELRWQQHPRSRK